MFSYCIMDKFFYKEIMYTARFVSYLKFIISKRTCVDLKNLPSNHRLWKISSYHLNNQDEIKKKFIYKEVLVNLFNTNLNDLPRKYSWSCHRSILKKKCLQVVQVQHSLLWLVFWSNTIKVDKTSYFSVKLLNLT